MMSVEYLTLVLTYNACCVETHLGESNNRLQGPVYTVAPGQVIFLIQDQNFRRTIECTRMDLIDMHSGRQRDMCIILSLEAGSQRLHEQRLL